MIDLNNTVVTQILPPIVVHSEKGRRYRMNKRNCFGLSLCIRGQITYTMGEKTYISTPGHAVLLPEKGTYSLLGNKDGLFPLINFHAQNLQCHEITVIPLATPEACLYDFEALRNLYLHERNPLKQYSVFYDLLSKISSSYSPKNSKMDFIARFIEENIQQHNLSNDTLAKQLGISEVYFRKLFVSYYHCTPKQFILDLRIRKAQQMLVDTPYAVSAIGEACGFSSVYHFCRIFKQRTGFTPTQYAMENKIYQI